MIAACVFVKVKKEFIEEFSALTSENHKKSIEEEGNLRFDFLQKTDDPTEFLLFEVYSSEKAALRHKDTEHYLLWKKTVEDMMEKPRASMKYRTILPKEEEKWKTQRSF
ncbi:antibiotic biosynthesis monooxygenase [candidate division WOR-3 bacterium]|nr:antibiotic biosynthesis monooxygenase [candidate division WOR-3 bacterium]